MKLLLDENLPKRLKADLVPHEVYTVRDMGWNGIKNGELLKLMQKDRFDVLLTFDKNIQYQQNFQKYPLPVLVLNARDNTYLTISQLVPQIIAVLNGALQPGGTIVNI